MESVFGRFSGRIRSTFTASLDGLPLGWRYREYPGFRDRGVNEYFVDTRDGRKFYLQWDYRILEVSVVLVFVVLGWKYIRMENYTPYIPANTGTLGEFGFSGILRGAAIVFFAFLGFDAVSTAAQETKNPKRNMPIGILMSLVVCTILYMLFAHVMTGVVHYSAFAGQNGSLLWQ